MGDRARAKWGGAAMSLSVGGPHLTLCHLGRGLSPYQITKWHLDPSNRLATIHKRYRQDRTTAR